MTRRKNKVNTDRFSFSYDLAAISSDTTVKLWKAPAGSRARITRCVYVNPTGLAANVSNFADIKVLNAALVAFNVATSTVALAANTTIEMTKSATDANTVLAPGADLSVFVDITGVATLPAGRLVIEGDIL